MARGGYRPGSGRKPKVEEQALIEKLSPLEEVAFKALKDALQKGERWAVKLYFEYMYGRPREQKVSPEFVEQPLFPEINITRHIVGKGEAELVG